MAEDVTNPDFLYRATDDSTQYRTVKTLSGRGIAVPGYRVRGSQPGALSENVVTPNVVKMVSPLTGQGPASPLATGRYANMNESVVQVNRLRVQRSVAPLTGQKVIRPPKTALRRMDTKGTGTVGYV